MSKSVAPLAQGQKIDPSPNAPPPGNTAGGFSGFLDAASFPTQPTVTSGIDTMVTLSADFMKHGSKDLLTIDSKAQLHLLSNNGDGTFAAPVNSSGSVTGSYYTGYIDAVVHDYDNDGYPDVIARDNSDYRLTFFHNNHDGTFTLAKYITLPSDYSTAALLLGDATGDGVDDLITFIDTYSYSTGNTTTQVQVYAGNSSGDFNTTPIVTTYTFEGAEIVIPNRGALIGTNAGHKALYIEALSLNGQGVNGATVFALGLNGDGTFQGTPYTQQDFISASIYANTNNGGLSVADLNNDGVPDLTVYFGDGYIYTALGASDGSFPAVVTASPAFSILPETVVESDINGDGYPDLIVKDIDTLEVLPGLGNGSFGKASTYYTVSNSNSGGTSNSPGFNMVYDDFTGDGVPDLLYMDTGSNGYNRAVLMAGQGGGEFQGPVGLPADNQLGYDPGHLYGEAMFDTNGDGRADLITLDTYGLGPYYLRTALSNGKGGFNLITALAATHGSYTVASVMASHDFNGDGLEDLVLEAYTTPAAYTYNFTLAVSLSKGDGTFSEPVFLDTNGVTLTSALSSVAVGDINGDGIPDIVAVTPGGYYATAAMLTFLGKSDGTFQPAMYQTYGHSYAYAGITLADFNGDGKLDLFISDDGTLGSVLPQASIIFGDNSGTFDTTKAVPVVSGLMIRKALVGDLNGDGKPDLVLLSGGQVSGYTITTTDRNVIVYLNNGDGTFTRSTTTYEAGAIGGTGHLADFNGDGKLDLVFAVDYPWDRDTASNAGTQLLLGNGDGTFGTPSNLTLPPSVSFLASGDVDGDGSRDLMSFSYYVGSIAVLRNISGSGLQLTADQSTVNTTQGVNLTATITASVDHRPTPLGTVTFSLAGNTLGTGTLQGGTASLYVSGLPVGSDKITATYSGDTNYSANQIGASTVVTVTSAPVTTPDFSVTVPSGAVTLSSGGTSSTTFSLTANSTYSGLVNLSAANLPKDMTISFSSTSVMLSPNATSTVTATINTNAKTAAIKSDKNFFLAGSCFCLLFCFSRRRRSFRMLHAVFLLGTLTTVFGLAGCASDSTTTDRGDYTVVVTATPAVTGATTKAFNVTVHVD